MPFLSIIINCDTRPEKATADGLFSGTSNLDYLTDGIFNKLKFFKDFDTECIVFIDEHLPVPDKTLEYLRSLASTVVIRKHTHEESFNDYNYLSALQLARGQYVAHFDQDTACFTSNSEPIHKMIRSLDQVKFVSYPSYWSPRAVDDPSFGKRTWASTRFFICKRETLKFDELRACIVEPNYGYEKYGDSPRRCNWLEHFLTLTNNDSCFYPPMEIDNYTIFSWGKYEQYTLRRLNELAYTEIRQWLNNHPIVYPNDIHL